MVNKSRKCPQCQLVSFADAEVCKRCGATLTTSEKPRARLTPRTWVGIIAVVVIVCTFGLVIWAFVFTQPSTKAPPKVFACDQAERQSSRARIPGHRVACRVYVLSRGNERRRVRRAFALM